MKTPAMRGVSAIMKSGRAPDGAHTEIRKPG
jgi:hypothetical protein